MKKTFRCEYCGRQIKTEECPYCGGVNDIPLYPISDGPSGKAADCIPPVPPRKRLPVNKSFPRKVITFFQIHTVLRALLLAVLSVVVVLIISAVVLHNNYEKNRPEIKDSDNVLELSGPLTITVSSLGKEWDLTLPSPLRDLEKDINFLPPIIDDPAKDDPDKDGILDLLPFGGTSLRDSYGLFYYDIINDSYETAPYTQATCDMIHTYHSSYKDKVSSIKIQGKELITDLDSVINAFGEPSSRTTDQYSTEIEYKSTSGRITLSFDKEDDYAFPDLITIENLAQNRKYY